MLDSTIFMCCLLCVLANILESLKLKLCLVSKLHFTFAFLSSPILKSWMSSKIQFLIDLELSLL